MRRRFKRVIIAAVVLVFLGSACGLATVAYAKWSIQSASQGRVVAELDAVPERKVVLVLGCARYLADGRENLYFKYRMDAAAELFEAGKASYILVSGDNSRKSYDESTDMKEALLDRGVPAECIVCDFAGFSTLDSVIRAKEVFQEDELLIVSQEFHVLRAIYIAGNHGIDLLGYPARDVNGRFGFRTKLREHLAQVKAVLDVRVLDSQPTYLGDPVLIGVAQ